MRSRFFVLLLFLASSAGTALPGVALAESPFGNGWIEEDDGGPQTPPSFQFPGMPPIQVRPDGHFLRPQPPGAQSQGPDSQGSNAQDPHSRDSHHAGALKPSLSPAEQAKAAKAEALKRAMAPQKTHAEIRGELLNALFRHLSKAADSDEAEGIAAAIERLWLQSDSPTANLLMARGLAAMQAKHLPLALTVFDRLLILEPTWSAAWEKRATTRLLGGDLDGAIADMRQAVKLDPKNFSTLAALGLALHREGLDKEALTVLRQSLALDPQQPAIKDLVDKLGVEVEGRDI